MEMNIPKAIEILELYMKGSDEAEPVDFDKAINLGIKAMKRIKSDREETINFPDKLLPGETKE